MPSRSPHWWERIFRTDALAGLAMAVITVGGWVLGWLEGIPWTIRVPAILLTLCALLWAYDRFIRKLPRVAETARNATLLAPAHMQERKDAGGPASIQQQRLQHPLQLGFQYGVPECRLVRDDTPPDAGVFDVLKVTLTNHSQDKTIKGIELSVHSRSHVLNGLKPLHEDRGPVFVAGRRGKTEISPGASEDYVIMSRNFIDPTQIILGDRIQDPMDYTRLLSHDARHFLTLRVTCSDAPLIVNTTIIRTSGGTEPVLDVIEFDFRTWTHEREAPLPYYW